jgi:hypothetical protein
MIFAVAVVRRIFVLPCETLLAAVENGGYPCGAISPNSMLCDCFSLPASQAAKIIIPVKIQNTCFILFYS